MSDGQKLKSHLDWLAQSFMNPEEILYLNIISIQSELNYYKSV